MRALTVSLARTAAQTVVTDTLISHTVSGWESFRAMNSRVTHLVCVKLYAGLPVTGQGHIVHTSDTATGARHAHADSCAISG